MSIKIDLGSEEWQTLYEHARALIGGMILYFGESTSEEQREQVRGLSKETLGRMILMEALADGDPKPLATLASLMAKNGLLTDTDVLELASIAELDAKKILDQRRKEKNKEKRSGTFSKGVCD